MIKKIKYFNKNYACIVFICTFIKKYVIWNKKKQSTTTLGKLGIT